MIQLINGHQTAVILLHEVFGVNEHMRTLSTQLQTLNVDVYCPNLLQREPFLFSEEQEAYHYYQTNVGPEKALTIVRQLERQISAHYSRIIFVGCSVGATLAWLCSEFARDYRAEAVCIYGSRIRDYVTLTPKIPTLLIFASNEASFNPSLLQHKLQYKHGVSFTIFQGKHGFMNSEHPAFEQHLVEQTFQQIREFLQLPCEVTI